MRFHSVQYSPTAFRLYFLIRVCIMFIFARQLLELVPNWKIKTAIIGTQTT